MKQLCPWRPDSIDLDPAEIDRGATATGNRGQGEEKRRGVSVREDCKCNAAIRKNEDVTIWPIKAQVSGIGE